MGFLGEIFHPQHDEVEKPAEASSAKPEVAETPPAPPDSAAPPTTETGAAAEVKPGGSVDSVTASSDSSTVDLGSVQVSPVSAESSSAGEVEQPVGASADSAATEVVGGNVEKSSVEPDPASGSNEINVSVDPAAAVESSDPVDPSDGKTDSSKSDDSNKSAEELLAEWQQEKPDKDATEAAPNEASSEESQHTTEPDVTDVEAAPAESGEAQKPEASTDDTKEEDFALKLTREAADEAEKIDKAMGASGKDTEAETPDESEIQAVSSEVPVKTADEAEAIDAAIAETKPEIHGIGGEIKPETTGEAESSNLVKPESDVTTTEPESVSTTIEDAPFPAPPVDVDESGADTADTDVEASDGNETETGAEDADTIGGADVHLDRAEYLKPEESAADIDSDQQKKGEVSGAEVIDFTKHIDALNAAEEAVRNAKQDLIDRQKAA